MPADFLIIGAQRCATGWIAAVLGEHPDVYVPATEVRYFDQHYDRGGEWWESCITPDKPVQIYGEKTANYLYHPDVPRRIHQTCPDVKLICCLRDPLDRMYSQYLLRKRTDQISSCRRFIEEITSDREYIERGLYFRQLRRYFRYFSSDQMCITFYHDMESHRNRFIKGLYQFLGVKDSFTPDGSFDQIKVGRREGDSMILRWLSYLMLSRYSPVRSLYSKFRSRLFPDPSLPLSTAQEHRLRSMLEPGICNLEDLTGRDLGTWKTS